MLWLALDFPLLPLDVLPLPSPSEASATPADPPPAVVVESRGRIEDVLLVNPAAALLGVRSGMKLSSALVLAGRLAVLRRQPEAEAATLESAACWALQFSSTVTLEPPQAVLLEIGGSLRYFGGWPGLLAEVLAKLPALGCHVRLGAAPTPLAALWLARHEGPTLAPDGGSASPPSQAPTPVAVSQAGQAGTRPAPDTPLSLINPCLDPAALGKRLAPLPLAQLHLPEAMRRNLALLGLRTFGQVLALPRTGLTRRFGTDLPLLLDRALGHAADPRPGFVPPSRFERRLEFDHPVETAEGLVFAGRRLLVELAAFLLGRGLGVQEVLFQLSHAEQPASRLVVKFGQPTRTASVMVTVLREKLERHRLSAPVTALALVADQLHELGATPFDLFGQQTATADFDLLCARLAARLGEAALQQIAVVADHRPEHAWRRVPLDEPPPSAFRKPPPEPLPDLPALGPRPGWLLPQPEWLPVKGERPWYGEPLTCQGRGERVETGWWDGTRVSRDYYLALAPSGRRYWIFQDRNSHEWYLHGCFQ